MRGGGTGSKVEGVQECVCVWGGVGGVMTEVVYVCFSACGMCVRAFDLCVVVFEHVDVWACVSACVRGSPWFNPCLMRFAGPQRMSDTGESWTHQRAHITCCLPTNRSSE